jgi:cytochrome c biogenesis factor
MYEFLKGLHNLLRWIVMLGGVWALITAVRGLAVRAQWTASERRAGAIFAGSLHLQIVVGLLLYLVSPLIRGGFSDFAAAMGDRATRFFLMEHMVIMILAAVAAQVGLSTARRASDDRSSFVRATVGYALAWALLLYGIPWWRPLLPWG